MLTVVIVVGALVLGCAVYGWFEAGWLRKRVLEVPIDGSPRRSTAPDRTPVGLSPRRAAVARQRRERACCRLGRTASARPRLRHRGPRLASTRRAASTRAARAARRSVRDSRKPRRRRDARSVLAGRRAARPRAGAAPPRRGETVERHGGRVSVVGVDPRRTALVRSRPTALVDATPAFAFSCATSRRYVDKLPAGQLPSRSLGSPSRRPDRLPLRHTKADARPSTRPVRRRGVRDAVRGDARLSGDGDDVRPIPVLARPEVTEPVLRQRD